MKVTIAKVDEVFFDGEAQSLTVPGSAGQLTVLPRHESLVTTLKPGTITVRATQLPGGQQFFDVAGGVLEVHNGGAVVIL